MHEILTYAWFGLMCLMLAFYVITDGFDLGVGILSLFSREETERDQMFLSIGHVWDANETWLVVLGGAMFGAFPLAYATLMEQLYVPVMVLIASLIMRGAAIEFRHAATSSRRGWDIVFGIGSLMAAGCQGAILGQIITGLAPGLVPAGFAAISALGVIAGYALLGATYLIKKAHGELVQASRRHALISLLLSFGAATVLTAGTMFYSEIGHGRWMQHGVFPLLLVLALLAAFAGAYVMYALHIGSERGPFRGAIGLFLASFAGLGVSLFPDLVPGKLSLAQAASDSTTLVFMLCGIAVVFPVMIGYNLYQYHVFRGRVQLEH
jgi:cytochrome d ubiquinol oxidase subunit II